MARKCLSCPYLSLLSSCPLQLDPNFEPSQTGQNPQNQECPSFSGHTVTLFQDVSSSVYSRWTIDGSCNTQADLSAQTNNSQQRVCALP